MKIGRDERPIKRRENGYATEVKYTRMKIGRGERLKKKGKWLCPGGEVYKMKIGEGETGKRAKKRENGYAKEVKHKRMKIGKMVMPRK